MSAHAIGTDLKLLNNKKKSMPKKINVLNHFVELSRNICKN